MPLATTTGREATAVQVHRRDSSETLHLQLSKGLSESVKGLLRHPPQISSAFGAGAMGAAGPQHAYQAPRGPVAVRAHDAITPHFTSRGKSSAILRADTSALLKPVT